MSTAAGMLATIGAVNGILLALSVLVFIYLGVAMFRAEWF
ncbi:MAG: potassium-transporting ATPase subunit F [Acidimicrobiales bacterium]|jgi:K+-transporting ATPase KdpF subunit